MNDNTPCQRKLIKGWIFSCYIFCNFWTKVLWYYSSFTCNQIVYYKELLFMWATHGLDFFLIKKESCILNELTDFTKNLWFCCTFSGFQTSRWGALWISVYTSEQNRRLWSALQTVSRPLMTRIIKSRIKSEDH